MSDGILGGEGVGARQGGEGEEGGWRLVGEVGEGGMRNPVLISYDQRMSSPRGVVSWQTPGLGECAASGPCAAGHDSVPAPSAVPCPCVSGPEWEGADGGAWPSRPAVLPS